MNLPEAPPAASNFFFFRLVEIAAKGFERALRLQITLNLGLQRFQYPRHPDQHRDALTADRRNDFRGVERILEIHCATQQRRDPQTHELSKNVAQWHQIEKSEGVDETFPFEVWLYARFQGLKVRQDVSV